MTGHTRAFRNHFVSVYQSAAADVARSAAADQATSGPDGLHAKSVQTGGDLAAAAAEVADMHMHGQALDAERKSMTAALTCASLGLEYLQALASGDQQAKERIEGQFTDARCDVRWPVTLYHYYSQFLTHDGKRPAIPYRRVADIGNVVIPIKPDARIALVSDWGTGAGPALGVVRQIAMQSPDIVVHLGDIYFSGTPRECTASFYDIVQSVLDRAHTNIPVYALAGNHDMYSGGKGYYDLIDELNTGAARARQRASLRLRLSTTPGNSSRWTRG